VLVVLDAEKLTNVIVAAVENGFIAASGLADVSEGLYDAETEFLALLALVDSNVLNVTDGAKAAEELALDKESSDGDDGV